MNRKTVSGIMLAMLLTSMLTLAINIQTVKAEPKTWIVDDDGPADFKRIQDAIYAASPGDIIYVHNGIYHEHIIIPINDLTLIGENKSATIIDGDGMGQPIVTADDRRNVVFKRFTVRNAGWLQWTGIGIRLKNTVSCVISDSVLLSNRYGIALLSVGTSVGNIISGNLIKDSELAIANFWDEPSVRNIVVGNSISNSSTGIYFNYPQNIQIVGNTISNMTGEVRYGIHFQMGGLNNTVIGNTVMGYTDYGIAIRYADKNFVSGNTLRNNFYGIDLSQSSCDNTVTGNNLSGNGVGISVFDNSNNNLITMNDFSDSVPVGFYISDIGIWVESSHDNIIDYNSIINNGYGFYLPFSSNNKIYHNNIIDNTIQVNSFESANIWDAGYPSGGNYWSGYADADLYSGPYQNETGSDGIWDHPYVIDADIRDNYPFTPTADAAVISVLPSSAEVYVGQMVSITVTVQNQGSFNKTFKITLKCVLKGVEHPLGTQTVFELSPNTNATLTFSWTTTDIAVHTIKAETAILPGETDTADNTMAAIVKVKMLGDINNDYTIDMFDLVAWATAFGTEPGGPGWNPQADIYQDNTVDIFDGVIIAQNFGKTYP